MKNLKKILSLSLALVMLMGMMVIAPASAADEVKGYAALADKDEIVNIDAVALLVDLGIIEGKPGKDGNVYDPTGIVDRATMAKLVTTLHFGAADQAQFLGTSSDLTDIKGNWAEGYVLYCYSQNIIAGNGLGQFNPSDKVTVAQAAKMLLVALGYDADKAGLVGADWAVNTIAKATAAGILNGVGLRSTDELDRDTLALMMYNTLFARQVTYSTFYGNEAIVKNNSLGLATYGLVRVDGIVTASDKDTVTFEVSNTVPAESSFPSTFKLGGQQAYVGKDCTIYVKVETEVTAGNGGFNLAASVETKKPIKILGVYSTEVTLNTSGNTVSSDNGTKWADLIEGNKAIAKIDTKDASNAPTYFYNGSEVLTAKLGNVKDLAANVGVVVSFTDNDGDGYANIVRFTEYTYAKVTKVAKDDVTFGDAFGESAYVVASPAAATKKWDLENIVSSETLEKDDIVYGYVNGNGDLVVEVAEKIEGKVNGVPSNKKSVTVDGDKYTYANGIISLDGTYTVSANTVTGVATKQEVELYADANGYIIAINKLAESEKDFLFVDSALSTLGLNNAQQAIVFFADGTSDTVELVKLDGNKFVASGAGAGETTTYAVAGTIYKYSTNSKGQYELTSVAGQASFAGGKFTNGKAPVTVTSGTNFSISTEAVVVNTKNGNTYTGFDNVPTMSSMKGVVAYKSGTTAEIVFLADTTLTAENKTKFVITDTTFTELEEDGTTYYVLTSAIVDGVAGESIAVTKSFYDTYNAKFGAQGGGFYQFTAESTEEIGGEDCVATLATTDGDVLMPFAKVVTSFSGGILEADGKTYTTNSDTMYVGIKYVGGGAVDPDKVNWELDGKAGNVDLSASDVVKASSDTLASEVYVQAKDGVAQIVYVFMNTKKV